MEYVWYIDNNNQIRKKFKTHEFCTNDDASKYYDLDEHYKKMRVFLRKSDAKKYLKTFEI